MSEFVMFRAGSKVGPVGLGYVRTHIIVSDILQISVIPVDTTRPESNISVAVHFKDGVLVGGDFGTANDVFIWLASLPTLTGARLVWFERDFEPDWQEQIRSVMIVD